MRAVVFGVLASVLALGSAQAVDRSCPVSAPKVASSRAQWPSDLKRPDLVGKTFIVEKVASHWQPRKSRGFVALLLVADGERFVSIQSLDGRADSSDSFSAADPEAKRVNWRARDKSFEDTGPLYGGFTTDTGPLSHLYLDPKC